MARARARGFTLIELMVVVTIVGVLASVAIPTFHKFSLRAKSAERMMIMLRIKQAIQDYYVRNGSSVPASSGGLVSSGYNPPWPPASVKRAMRTNLAGWNVYFSGPNGTSSLNAEIEGALYYSYYFQVQEAAGGANVWLWSAGDLDADGAYSWKDMQWTRTGGMYQLSYEYPVAGNEDDVSTYRTF
jgi:prepilin-type N-terminal cleavage/methylation domain-containing protein